MIRRAAAILLISTGAAGAQPFPGDPVAGGALATRLCASCHEVADGTGRGRVAVAPDFRAIAAREETTALGLRVFLQTPHGDMPDVRLTPRQADDIISYILSLR